MFLIGVDGGGTKTVLSACDLSGHVLAIVHEVSLYANGAAGIGAILHRGISTLLDQLNATAGEIQAACLGIPCWGEDVASDRLARQAVDVVLGEIPKYLCNDCEPGWAGSLAMEPGINVVVGTGMIAYGRNTNGEGARSGGWSQVFSDEGSGYWLGKKLLEIFSKESDGRVPKGALYSLVRDALSLKRDFDIIPLAHNEILPFRDKTASLQRLLLQAAQEGDQAAIECYGEAVNEIVLAVLAVCEALNFDSPTPVSYSGGVFKAGEIILSPFTLALVQKGLSPCSPIAPPWIGALLLAADTAASLNCTFRDTLVNQSRLPRYQSPL